MQLKGLGERARAIATTMVRGADERPAGRADEGRPPDWLTELDQHDGAEELSFTLYSDLGEVVEARTGAAEVRGDE